MLTTSADVLGHIKKKNSDWSDENNKVTQDVIAKKRAAYHGHLAQPSCPVKKATF